MKFIRLLMAAMLAAYSFSWGAAAGETLPDYNTSPIEADRSGMEKNAMQIAADMGLGWNLGNTLEASGGETGWGNPMVTKEFISLVSDSGFNTIRLPVAWDQYADTQTGKIDDAWLDRVTEVVDYAIAEDMYVVINIHWDGGWLENNVTREARDDVAPRQRAYWQQIATHFRDHDERLVFAGANEPNVDNQSQMAVLADYHQIFVDAVRETGGRNAYRTLILQGPRTDIEKTRDLWPGMPEDTVADRMMAEVHFYTPWNFAGMEKDENWGKMFFFWGEDYHYSKMRDRNANWGEEDMVDDLFAMMQHQFTDKGVPVLLGEYGAISRRNLKGEALERHLASRAWYLEYVTRSALEHGLVPVYWDNGHTGNFGFGLFDRNRNEIADEQALEALLRGASQ
ncbi:glycoside hydrolase family 5 protein [Aquisalinus luteolus]|uniref:Cellulase n=2 Tax=Aquisalinus luteolus TaxID=1566827 RepID=A0A8J3A3H9_9PROT|nr:glycoside hydrolase family 5 protein [Aquisalinus luteolus]GGI00287.1 cellulase [Aquisalinus luteolus]